MVFLSGIGLDSATILSTPVEGILYGEFLDLFLVSFKIDDAILVR